MGTSIPTPALGLFSLEKVYEDRLFQSTSSTSTGHPWEVVGYGGTGGSSFPLHESLLLNPEVVTAYFDNSTWMVGFSATAVSERARSKRAGRASRDEAKTYVNRNRNREEGREILKLSFLLGDQIGHSPK